MVIIYQVLSQACQEQGTNPDNFDLNHRGKDLDLSLTVRFANLPNNCQLELRQRAVPRVSGQVSIAVQTDSGQRTTGKFSSDTTLHHVISSTTGIPAVSKGKELVCLYTQKEIVGEQALSSTTLKDIGLTSGSAVLRVTTRDIGMGHVQAHVEDLKLKKTSSGPSKAEEVVADVKQNVSKFGKSLKKMMSGVFDGKGSKDESSGRRLGDASDYPTSAATSSKKTSLPSIPVTQQPTARIPDYDVNPDIVWLGERDSLLFKLEDMQKMVVRDPSSQETDDFFEVTQDDVALMYHDLKSTVADLENRPLETKALRDKRRQTTRYAKTVLRICFPNEGLFLQGTFESTETVGTVQSWVRSFLADANMDFYLYTTPPKEILKSEWTMVEKKLIPAAVIHFGRNQTSTGGVFKKELYHKITSFDAISTATRRLRDAVAKTLVDVPRPAVSSSEVAETPRDDQSGPTPRQQLQDQQKVPKWFKPSK